MAMLPSFKHKTLEHKNMVPYLSESEIGRLLNVSPPRLRRAIERHNLTPDLLASGRVRMWKSDRLEEFRGMIQSTAAPDFVEAR
jgi:hypothetical protein